MSWPEYLQSSSGFNDNAYDSQRNNAPQDGDNESTYFISETSEFETDMLFNSRPQLIDWVQNTERRLGYVVVIKRSDANLNISFMCDCGGIYKSKKLSTKNTGSKIINCPFALKAKCLSIDDCWSLKVICDIHNHEPALYLEGHPYLRRLSEKESRLVEELIRNNVKPRDILSTLRRLNVENLSTLPTIYNARIKFKIAERSGKTQMQVVMDFLDKNDYVYYSRADTSTNEFQELFFAHRRSLALWYAFPHVVLMDATYNTNRYEMPLLEIVGVTPTNMTFCIAFVFMHKETESHYTWALNCLKSTMDGCMSPRVIVIDRELACMNACNRVFPGAKGLLCRWHINTSIKRKYKALMLGDCWTTFYNCWNELVESETKEAYIANVAQVEIILLRYPENVLGDGNCGFRATAVSLGYSEDYFPTIRFDLYNELLAHTEEYSCMFGRDFEAISHTLNYFGSEAVGTDCWLIVSYTGLLIANKYGVVVTLLDKRGSSTFFPSWLGPQDIPNHRVVVIALVYGNHYVKVDLQREHPMPKISPLWNHFKSQRSAAWETLYGIRLNAYIPPNVSRNNYDNPRVNISDSY